MFWLKIAVLYMASSLFFAICGASVRSAVIARRESRWIDQNGHLGVSFVCLAFAAGFLISAYHFIYDENMSTVNSSVWSVTLDRLDPNVVYDFLGQTSVKGTNLNAIFVKDEQHVQCIFAMNKLPDNTKTCGIQKKKMPGYTEISIVQIEEYTPNDLAK